MEDDEAVEGLERLGLTSYEARVFLGLQRLGAATASEISEVVEVPRSQVYGAAERLEERGLLETRQSTPTAYRPVSLEEARTRLLDDLQETGTRTFEYLETLRESREADEQTEAIWLVDGQQAVTARATDLIVDADDRILVGADDPGLLEGDVLAALEAAAADGLDVVVGSNAPAVLAVVDDVPGVTPYRVPDERSPEVSIGRVLIVDDRTILLSVFSSRTVDAGNEEVAFWSADSAFAAVLLEFIEDWFLEPFGD